MEIVVWNGIGELPHFSPDIDVDPLPPSVAALRAQIARVDALAITTPEYAHGIPGSLKNALDWLVSALEPLGKPVLLVSASPSGAAFAHAHLLEVLRTMMSGGVVDGGNHVFSSKEVGRDGEVTSAEVMAAFASGFAQLAERVQAARAEA
jgi:NAD(P)H-dependent FMN reductase